jgi:hypothetical protein
MRPIDCLIQLTETKYFSIGATFKFLRLTNPINSI